MDTRTARTVREQVGLTLLKKLRPVPLECTWIFWYSGDCKKQEDYANKLQELAVIDTVQSFWGAWNSLPLNLPAKHSIHMFKRGVKPLWEDEANKNGGQLTFRVPTAYAVKFFKDVLLLLTANHMADQNEDILGASISSRSNNDLVTLWNRNSDNVDGIHQMTERILREVPRDMALNPHSIYYNVRFTAQTHHLTNQAGTPDS